MKNRWMMRIAAGLLIAATAGIAGYSVGAQDEPTQPVKTLEVNEVARVGENIITAEQFIERLVERERIYFDPDLRTAREALDSLVIDRLLEVEAERLGARAKRNEVQPEYEDLLAARKEELRVLNQEIEAEQVNKGLEPQPYSWEEYLKYKYDVTPKELEVILMARARRQIQERLVVHYWMASTKSADADGIFMRSRSDLVKVRTRLVKGEKFDELAGEFSQDIHTRDNKGTIGTVYVNDGILAEELNDVFWELGEGELSPIIETDLGFWILKKGKVYLPNTAEFFNLREECFKKKNITPSEFKKWLNSLSASGRYAFERRMPGWDCDPDRP